MKIRPILLEKEDKRNATIASSSGVLVAESYVVTTSNLLLQVLQDNKELLREIEAGKLHLYTRNPVGFRVIWNNPLENTFSSKSAHLFALFKCKHVNEFYKNDFKDLPAPSDTSEVNLKEAVSVFVILALEGIVANEQHLQATLYGWLKSTRMIVLNKCDPVRCISSPFGSRQFLNSVSEGIVSTTLKNKSLFLSDCASAPGSEGGLIYLKSNPELPVGIVISSFNWWRKDWIGFTLAADIRPIIRQLTFPSLKIGNGLIRVPSVSSVFESCLAQVKCGPNWGTCVLISKEKGIFLTNAHVINGLVAIRLLCPEKVTTAQLIYKTPDDSPFDLALIQSDDRCTQMLPPSLDIVPYAPGDKVYCAGYPLLSSFANPAGITVTCGVISSSNPHMIKTTCGVYPGFSGGGVFRPDGVLLGIIVSNTKLNDSDVVYPKHNVAVPFGAIAKCIFDFLENGDANVLTSMAKENYSYVGHGIL